MIGEYFRFKFLATYMIYFTKYYATKQHGIRILCLLNWYQAIWQNIRHIKFPSTLWSNKTAGLLITSTFTFQDSLELRGKDIKWLHWEHYSDRCSLNSSLKWLLAVCSQCFLEFNSRQMRWPNRLSWTWVFSLNRNELSLGHFISAW